MASQVVTKAVQASLDCSQACDTCITECLSEIDPAPFARCIRLCMDCSDICVENIRLIRRDSEMMGAFCHLLMEACDVCAEECRKLSSTSESCRLCATACQNCAVACKNLALAMAEA